MHPALRKGPLFTKKTIFHFFTKAPRPFYFLPTGLIIAYITHNTTDPVYRQRQTGTERSDVAACVVCSRTVGVLVCPRLVCTLRVGAARQTARCKHERYVLAGQRWNWVTFCDPATQ